MKMAKPERHPWSYSPQWNYYPPHVLNFPKLPYPNGYGHHQINSDPNENYLPIRCPEPRRPYQVPYPAFESYSHQENRSLHGSYAQQNLYSKQYIHRPIPHENSNNSFKINECVPSFTACSNNVPETKDQSNCYQNSWKTTSHYKKKTPELDVRKFLATWQEKDDDLLDVSSEAEETKTSQHCESTPLDCTKRTNSEKALKPNYDGFVTGHITTNPTGCVVQPYYIKDNNVPFNRNFISNGEMNNNNPQRNNLNYEEINHHSYHNKNYYSHADYWKTTNEKMLSCEHNASYSQHYNHCDINVNSFRNNFSYVRPKESFENSDRSQYNLTSSLESGDLFCDINSRNDEHHPKQQIIHPFFNDGHHRPIHSNCDEQSYYNGNYNNNYSENIVYTELHPPKEPWELYPSNMKCKESFRNLDKNKVPVVKGPIHPYLNQPMNNTNPSSGGPISYEGAFNILPSLNDSNLSLNSPMQYTNSSNLSLQTNESSKSASPTLATNKSLPLPTVPKFTTGSGKVKPYHFNEEISSDDIDISIASSGELLVDEDHTGIGTMSVINFSRAKKEKLCNSLDKGSRNNKNSNYSDSVLIDTSSANVPSIISDNNTIDSNVEMIKSTSQSIISDKKVSEVSPKSTLSPIKPLEVSDQPLKTDVVDLTVLKTQSMEEVITFCEKPQMDYLDISNNYYDVPQKCSKTNDMNSNFANKCTSPSKNDSSLSDKSVITTVKDDHQSTNKDSPDSILTFHSTENDLCKDNCEEDSFITNDNLLLLAHCSQEYGCQIGEAVVKEQDKNVQNDSFNVLERNEKTENSFSLKSDINDEQKINDVIDEKCDQAEKKEAIEEKEFCETSVEQVKEKKSSYSCSENLNCDQQDENTPTDSCVIVGKSLPMIEDSDEISHNSTLQVQNGIEFSPPVKNGDLVVNHKDFYESLSKDYCDINENEPFLNECINTKDKEFNTIRCSSEFGCQIAKELSKDSENGVVEKPHINYDSEKSVKPLRDTVIKCSLRWDKIFNVMSDEDSHQGDVSLDLGPAKVELRMPTENYSSGHWKVVEADNKIQTSIVQVKRLILKRKSQSEERIPKMIIKKTDGKEYRSYLKNEPNETVLNCGKFKIFCDIPSKPKSLKNDQTGA